jgi:hypothetical protein
MNKIRNQMSEEVDAFIPVIRETYRRIATYQLNRTLENEATLRLQLTHATKEMQKFKPLLQRKWQVYIDALERQHLFPIRDLIFTFDMAIHQMHLRAGNKGLTRKGAQVDALSPWGKKMKTFLDERRRGVS